MVEDTSTTAKEILRPHGMMLRPPGDLTVVDIRRGKIATTNSSVNRSGTNLPWYSTFVKSPYDSKIDFRTPLYVLSNNFMCPGTV